MNFLEVEQILQLKTLHLKNLKEMNLKNLLEEVTVENIPLKQFMKLHEHLAVLPATL